jgi:hypothetical protein
LAASVLSAAGAIAAILPPSPAIVPEPVPEVSMAGFRFPETEATLTRWITEMSRATSAEAARVATEKIALHAWGLWTAVTSETRQTVDGQRLRVFETWLTPDELAAEDAAPAWRRPLTPRRRSALQPLPQLAEAPASLAPPAPADRAAAIDRVVGLVKFDPVAVGHIRRQELLRLSSLAALLDGGAQQITPFPSAAIAAKPVFQILRQRDLVDGHYALMKAWPGPPEFPQPWAPAEWPAAVWIDVLDGGHGRGLLANAEGEPRNDETTYPLSSLIHYRLSAADAAGLNRAKPGTDATAGDCAVLVAMHISTREIARWTWQTFWWTPTADNPPAPSSSLLANARPPALGGAARHYAMALAYTLLSPDQPYVGGENAGLAVYAYNPWIEARLGSAELPDSRAGFDPAGQPAANNVGVQSNCMSCHAQANYNPRQWPTAPRFTGARYVDLGAAEFVGTLQVDFLWSLPRHAK